MTPSTLQIVDARYTVGSTTILNGISFDAQRGEIIGLVGPNGSGKSTLLQTIVGAIPGASIVATIDGHPLPIARAQRARLVAYVEQQAIPVALTVAEVVALGRIPHQRLFSTPTHSDHRHVDRALHRTGSLAVRHRLLSTLSGGERQRVLIARGLAQDTPFLLLDEPTNHLDLAAQSDILTLIDSLADSGTGVVLAIHDLSHAAALCHRVIVIDHGRLAVDGPPAEVLTPHTIQQVFGVATRWLADAGGQALIFHAATARPAAGAH